MSLEVRLAEALAANEALKAKELEGQAELAELRKTVKYLEKGSDQHEEASLSSVNVPQKRDMSLQQLVKPWGGDVEACPVEVFLSNLGKAAKAGAWTQDDTLLVAEAKLVGAAATFLQSRPDLDTFPALKEALKERFGTPLGPDYYARALHSAAQGQGESARDFADRCRGLGIKAYKNPKGADPWTDKQIEQVVKASYVNGLRGECGKQLKFLPPQTLSEGIERATLIEQVLEKQPRSEVFGVTPASSRDSQGNCFNCGGRGHFARSCPTPRDDSRNQGCRPMRTELLPTRKGQRGTPRIRRTFDGSCFVCGKIGHRAVDCAMKARGKGQISSRRVRTIEENLGSPNDIDLTTAPGSGPSRV